MRIHDFGFFLTVAIPSAVGASDLSTETAAAKALVEAGKAADGRAAWEKILAQDAGHPDADWSLGLMACDAGDWEKALRHAKIAVTSDPKEARYQYGWAAANGIAAMKAGIFARLGYVKVCLSAYRRAAELEPRNLQYRWALFNYYHQAPGFAGGDREKALAQAAEIKAIDAESGRQALVQLHLGEKNPELAFRVYDDALRESPDDYVALYQFGRLTLQTDRRFDDGLVAFRRCLELKRPNDKDAPTAANVHWRIGNLWEKKKQIEQARVEYRAALALDPNFQAARQALEKIAQRLP